MAIKSAKNLISPKEEVYLENQLKEKLTNQKILEKTFKYLSLS